MLAAVLTALHVAQVPALTRDLLLGLAAICTVPQADHVRPQLFSLALFAWLLTALVSARRSRPVALLAVPIMLIWANLHGGWLVGAGTLAIWSGAGLIGNHRKRDELPSIVIAATAIAMTLVNPYGWHLWTFLAETVRVSRPDITDWQPIFRLGPTYVGLWALPAVGTAMAFRRAASSGFIDGQALAVVLMFATASFRVSRLLAFFAISFVILMGSRLQLTRAASGQPAGGGDRTSRFKAGVAGGLGLAVLVGSVASGARNMTCIRMEPAMFPEPGVVAAVQQSELRGRMLTWFDWGEYAIWHWAPRITVSLDGRRETVYSDAVIQQHLDFYFEPDKRQQVLEALRPDYVWLPSDLKVVDHLKSDGWNPIFTGDRSILLARTLYNAPPAVAPAFATSPRCFPGP